MFGNVAEPAPGRQGKDFIHALPSSRPERPFCLRALPRHHDLRRLGRHLGPDRSARTGRGGCAGAHRARCGHQFHRHGQCLCGRRERAHPRPVAAQPRGAARGCGDRDQGARAHGRRRQCARGLARPYPRSVQGQPRAAAARPYRPLSDPRVRRRDPHRGDAGGARHARAPRPCPLHRPVELGGLAGDEGGGDRRGAPSGADPVASGLLHSGRPRSRARGGADAEGHGHGPHGLEPAGGRLPVGKVRPRGQGRRRAPRGLRLPAGRQGSRLDRDRGDAPHRGGEGLVCRAGGAGLAPASGRRSRA